MHTRSTYFNENAHGFKTMEHEKQNRKLQPKPENINLHSPHRLFYTLYGRERGALF